jgi:thymidylate synthase
MSTVAQLSKEAFEQIFRDVKSKGKICSPRGQKVIEIENYTYELPPYVRFQSFESRKFKPNYVKEEFLWYLHGDAHDTSIIQHAKMWESLINSDGTINSNYGQYMFGKINGTQLMDTQFNRAVQALKDDKDSRRGSIAILQPRHLLSYTKDVPCTYSLNFRVRENKLNMSVHMRSQDGVFGMGNDAPTFSFVHEMVFVALKGTYPELELGNYHHIADSFHVYERHFEVLEKIASGTDKYIEIEVPKIESEDEVNYLLNDIRYAAHPHAVHSNHASAGGLPGMGFLSDRFAHMIMEGSKKISNNYDFSSWLLSPV